VIEAPQDETEDPVFVELLAEGAVALVTLNRPGERNPLDRRTISALYSQLVRLTTSNLIDAIIVTGAGPAFSAGGDLKGYTSLFDRPEEFLVFMEEFSALCDLLETCSQVTVAMVNGDCVAGGLEIALSCDFVTIAEDARIGDGHLRFGQLPGAGGSQRIVRAIGAQRAKHWLLSGDLFGAEEAVRAGLAIETAPRDRLLERTLSIVLNATLHSSLARRKMKQLIRYAVDTHLSDGLQREIQLVLDYATTSQDAREGLAAFAERRNPRYLGR